ncbi:MAG TPA: hypothetical protein VJI67_03085, partial [archaeon]|nr:hypothetical protein [archaeon]
ATSAPYWLLQYDTNLKAFVNALGTSTIDKIGYEYDNVTSSQSVGSAPLNETAEVAVATKEPKFISHRGSVFTSIGAASASLKYAKKLGFSKYALSRASTNATGNKVTGDYKAGDTALNDGGYIVTVDKVNTGGATGATVGGVENLGTSIATADSVVALDTGARPLVVLDTNPLATGSASVISFGGQLVNSVSASALSGAPLTAGGEPMVKVFGNKIVVAGYDASGTNEAATALISWLNANRDKVRG